MVRIKRSGSLHYWAKKQAGQEVAIPPLLPSTGCCNKFGLRSYKQNVLLSACTAVQEGAAQRIEGERNRKEQQRRRYNEEVVKTNELLNQAEDYQIACRIRVLVAAEEEKKVADAEWIAWAKAKADWFDPTVAAKDVYFGSRNHKRNTEQKTLRQIESPI